MSQTVEFFFDVVSPYSYLAASRIESIVAPLETELIWRPFFLGGAFQAAENSSPLSNASKGKHMVTDLSRLARYYQVPLQMPKKFPINTITAMRVLVGLPQDRIQEMAKFLFTALWAEGKDISDPQILTDLLGEELIALAGDGETKEKLKVVTAEAVRRGAFGAPTFFVGEEMFFGNDRLFLLEDFLKLRTKPKYKDD